VAVQLKAGARLRSSVCDAEFIAVKAPADAVDLRCGGHPLVSVDDEAPQGLSADPGFEEGVLIGKRYTDESGDLELLCTKAGSSSLSVGDQPLARKDAKPLPSSD
jgi:hypothetical protein